MVDEQQRDQGEGFRFAAVRTRLAPFAGRAAVTVTPR
jgi:hypothetical protein